MRGVVDSCVAGYVCCQPECVTQEQGTVYQVVGAVRAGTALYGLALPERFVVVVP